jgi:hypothetical protein
MYPFSIYTQSEENRSHHPPSILYDIFNTMQKSYAGSSSLKGKGKQSMALENHRASRPRNQSLANFRPRKDFRSLPPKPNPRNSVKLNMERMKRG